MSVIKISKRYIWLSLSVIAILGFSKCAKIGSPLGGPRDEDPPGIIKTVPPDSSVNFIPQKKITLTFDEYIVLKDVFQELILSPPVEGNIMALVKGKKIEVEFPNETKFDSTTYTLSFGNSIVDNNEGNVLENYEFIFSLKDYIDTLSVEGRVLSAFDYKPNEERMLVMLYRNLNDSAPLIEKPLYISRTNKLGHFSMHNLESGTYRLFGLIDANGNMMYDLPDETIAFSDSLIDLNPKRFEDGIVVEDSILYRQLVLADSVKLDSLTIDSLVKQPRFYTLYTEMLFFRQQTKNQYMTDRKRDRAERITFTFNEPLAEPLMVERLNYPVADSAWFIADISKKRDTLVYWLTDTSMIADDSLVLSVTYQVYDSLFNPEPRTDTLLFRIQETKSRDSRGSKARAARDDSMEEVKKLPVLSLMNNIDKPGAFDLNRKISLTSETPVESIRTERIMLFEMLDTIPVETDLRVSTDTNSMYKVNLEYSPEELTMYRLLVLDSAVTDIYGLPNDTIEISFKTQASDYYGILSVNLTGVKGPTILQLLDEKENVLRQNFLSSDGTTRYEYLYAKVYLLKVIIDANNNGEWDTGNYLRKLQPEKIEYFNQNINVRANWEMEFNWDLEN